MATKQELLDNPDSCWNKAGTDEPLFVLRAQDVIAPAAVKAWADLMEATTGNVVKSGNARSVAYDMTQWPTRKLPD